MKMDKSLFLLLTGTIAGVGTACIIKEAPATNTPATATNGTAATATPTAPPAPTTPPTADPGARHVTRGQLAGVRVGNDPNAADGGAPAPTPPPTAACLNDTATSAGDCGTISDKSCTWASKRCTAYKTYLKQQVAAKAISCTLAASASACSGTTTADCGKTAMGSACSDANVATACNSLASACKDTAANCTTALSALNSAGQQAVLTYCAKEGACSGGVAACVEAALFPAAEGTGGGGPRR